MTYKMNPYSFFGTCANESSHVTKVIKNIVSQNIDTQIFEISHPYFEEQHKSNYLLYR